MKLELFAVHGNRHSAQSSAEIFIKHARTFLANINGIEPDIHYEDGLADLVLKGIEVGSYGTRRLNVKSSKQEVWTTYGTGLALPRFSIASQRPLRSNGRLLDWPIGES